jgi:Leucine-rich repeat (LRR) protein
LITIPTLDVAQAIAVLNELPNLHMLSLAGDHISTLPADIGKLRTLESLELSENEFTDLPRDHDGNEKSKSAVRQ